MAIGSDCMKLVIASTAGILYLWLWRTGNIIQALVPPYLIQSYTNYDLKSDPQDNRMKTIFLVTWNRRLVMAKSMVATGGKHRRGSKASL